VALRDALAFDEHFELTRITDDDGGIDPEALLDGGGEPRRAVPVASC